MSLDDRDRALLWDMREACREIGSFVVDVEWNAFIADRKLCLAVERCLEIIGEAASRVSSRLRRELPDIEWHRIRGMRNLLAHEYGSVNYEIVFSTAKQDIPRLLTTLEGMVEG